MNEELLRQDLIRDEGEVLHVYTDSNGYLSLGVGRLVDPKKGGKISRAESEFMLHNDILKVQLLLDKYLPWWRKLSEVRQRVLANMAFNLGVGPSPEDPEGGLLEFKNTLAAMEQGDYEAAARGMGASLWATQVGPRATRLIKQMREG